MKYELTKEQINQAYENSELLKELFPDAFKPVLEAGKWYLRTRENGNTGLLNFSGNYDVNGYPFGYGVNIYGEWKVLDGNGWYYNDIRPATHKEIETALIAEAKKRGFKDGVDIYWNCKNVKYKNIKGSFEYCDRYNILTLDIYAIFDNGKWAEIIKETEIELTLDEIAEKFGVDKVKIKQ